MPRIGFILQAFYGDQIGGAERQVEMLANALQGEGWSTAYICERPARRPDTESIDGVAVFALPARKRRSAWLNLGALKSAMIESNADLFYQRVRHPYTGISVHIAKKLEIPIVFAAASKADMIRKQDLRWSSHAGNPIDRLLHPFGRYLEDWGVRHADEIIVQTGEQQALLKENYQRQGCILPNHILVNDISNRPENEIPQVLWISNIKPFKRPELFIKLAEQCTDLDVKFVMAGDCPNQNILSSIKQADNKLTNFSYVGPIPPIESERWIAESILIINTSEFEGFPNAFQQAWANGVPTLSIGIDPDGVISSHDLGGCLSSLSELEQLTRALIQDENRRAEIGKRAVQFARDTYDINRILPKYISLFDNLIKK